MTYTINLISLLCLTCSLAFSYSHVNGWCEQGGQAVITTSATSTTKVQRSYPVCTVSVFMTGTSTPATIYSSTTGTALGNPFVASTTGFWSFYAAEGVYDVTLSGAGFSVPLTLPAIGTLPVSILQFGADPTGATNSAAAITAAFAASNYVTAPCGTYTLGNTQLTIPRGVSFVMQKCAHLTSTTTATAVQITDPYNQTISLEVDRLSILWKTTDTASNGVQISGVTFAQENIFDFTITGFNIGLLELTAGGDITDNLFTHLRLDDNKIALDQRPAGGFGVNNNVYLKASMRINSGILTCPGGSPVSGSKYLYMETGSNNNNLWVAPEFQGQCVERSVDINSSYAVMMLSPRFEANLSNAVHFAAGTMGSTITNAYTSSGVLSPVFQDLGANNLGTAIQSISDTNGSTQPWLTLNNNGSLLYKIGRFGDVTSANRVTAADRVTGLQLQSTGTLTLNNSGFGTGAVLTGSGASGTVTTGTTPSTSGQIGFVSAFDTSSSCMAQDVTSGQFLPSTSNSTSLNIFGAAYGSLVAGHVITFLCTGR